jgi:hypothetical protein
MKSKKSLASLASYSSSNDDDSGVYSQKQLTSSRQQHVLLLLCRDSIFVKIQRGKIDAEKLLFLRSLYQSAGATKTLYVKVIQLKI